MTSRGPWLHTRWGRAFDLLAPNPDDVLIADVAFSLAGIYRYTGHSRITVAEHSVLCAQLVLRETGNRALAWSALVHDAHEAYFGDVSNPMKLALAAVGGGEALERLERGIRDAVRMRFGVPLELPESVKRADLTMLATEAPHELLWPPPRDWGLPSWCVPAASVAIRNLDADEAEAAWLRAVVEFSPDLITRVEAHALLVGMEAA